MLTAVGVADRTIIRAQEQRPEPRCSNFCERSVPIAILPCSWHGPVLYLTVPATRARRGPTVVERVPRPMGLCDPIRLARSVDLLTAVPLLAAILLAGGPAAAQTSIRFTLDGRLEGGAGTFFLPQGRGDFKAGGVGGTADEAASMLGP